MRANSRLLIFLLAFAGLCAGLAGAFWLERKQSASQAEPSRLERRPDFQLMDLAGKLQRIDQWDGSVVVINFWATWCPPCREEIPELVAVQKQLANRGVQLLGIAVDDRAHVRDFIQDQPFNYPILMAPLRGATLSQLYGNQVGALPYTVVIDRQQMIRFRRAGPVTEAELEPILARLLNEKTL